MQLLPKFIAFITTKDPSFIYYDVLTRVKNLVQYDYRLFTTPKWIITRFV